MEKKRKISIIGSTGSIGTQALEVIEKLDDKFEIIALAGGSNVELLKRQAEKFRPKYIYAAKEINVNGIETLASLDDIASNKENDIILVACSGKIGLKPTLKAIENGIDIALANKETLVMAGDIVMGKARENNVNIIPNTNNTIGTIANTLINPLLPPTLYTLVVLSVLRSFKNAKNNGT